MVERKNEYVTKIPQPNARFSRVRSAQRQRLNRCKSNFAHRLAGRT